MPAMDKPIAKQNYDFFLVLDFEATCQPSPRIDPQVSHLCLAFMSLRLPLEPDGLLACYQFPDLPLLISRAAES